MTTTTTYNPRKALSPHFKLAEFIKEYDIDNWANDRSSPLYEHRLTMLAATLEKIRTVIDSPIIINSGWRSKKRNIAVGGSPTSAHPSGYCADIKSPYLNAPALAKAIQRMEAEGAITYDQLIEYPKHVHISIDPRGRGQYWRESKY